MIPATEKEKLKKQINNNTHEVYMISLDEMDYIINKSAKSSLQKDKWATIRSKIDTSANYYSYGQDTFLLGKLMGDLGYAGSRAYIKFYGGKPHIILKGYPGLRKILNASRYGLNNAKVVKMGLGKYGGINAAKSGGILTIVLLTTYRVIDFFLRDEATLNQLIGSLATDVVKVGIATGASIAAAAGVSAVGTTLTASSVAAFAAAGGAMVAIGPLVVAILVGVAVSMLLTKLDEDYHITDKIIAALDEISEKGIDGIIAEKKAALIKTGQQLASDAAESVIDYAVERVQQIIIHTLRNIFRDMKVPHL